MISVVLPAFNESDTIELTVKDIYEYLLARDEEFEILIIENGSLDDTLEIGKALALGNDNIRFFTLDEANYGKALRKGFSESKGDIIVNFDVDFYDLDFLERSVSLIRESQSHCPAVIVGSKRNAQSSDERPLLRRMATNVFANILKFGFGLKVSDTHGIKALHRASVAHYEQLCHFGSDLFDTELIIRCEKAGLIVDEIPVTVKESRPARSALISRVPRTLMGLVKLKMLLIKESFVRRVNALRAKIRK